MKNFNVSVSENDFRELTSRPQFLRFIEKLGYTPAPDPWTPPDTWPSHKVMYKTPDIEDLQVVLAEMNAIYESRLYPAISDLAASYPRTLMFLTADYETFFILSVASTRLPGPVGNVLDETHYPSVQIHRIQRSGLRAGDLNFLEDLTRTLTRGEDQFRKIQYAFRRISGTLSGARSQMTGVSSGNEPAPDSQDLFYELRSELRPHRHRAYSGTWGDRHKYLVQPVLNAFEYRISPGRITRQDLKSEPDLFLYRGDPETPGTVPVAACLLADPLQIPTDRRETVEEPYRIVHPNIHALRLLMTRPYQRVIITDGRLWRIMQDTGEQIVSRDIDLFQALKLDSSREHSPAESFDRFLKAMTGIPAGDGAADPPSGPAGPDDTQHPDPRELVLNAENLLRDLIPDADHRSVAVDRLLFQCMVLLYAESRNRLRIFDKNRWNVPDFSWICSHADAINDGDLARWSKAHFKSLDDMDRYRNVANGLFHDPLEQRHAVSASDLIRSMPVKTLRALLKSLGTHVSQYMAANHGFTISDIREFASWMGRMLDLDRQTLDPSLKTDILDRLKPRIAGAAEKTHRLLDPNRSSSNYLRRYLSESFFRFHIVDARAGSGLRLLEILEQLVHEYLTAMDDSPLCPLHPRLPDVRDQIIRDSHQCGYFLDHTNLTDDTILRLQLVQHCLYGVQDEDQVMIAPVLLYLSVNLDGIRFPYIGHHFHPAAASARERLSKEYAGDIPEYIGIVSNRLAGLIAASRWFFEQELDIEAFGPNFTFTRAQYRMIMDRIRTVQEEHPDVLRIPLELAFPWIFHGRLTGETGSDRTGLGFDVVCN